MLTVLVALLRAFVVVGDRDKIVKSRTVGSFDVGRHVETLNGKVDVRVELKMSVFTVEALQSDDQNWRKRAKAEFLGSNLRLVAIWTAPERKNN